MEHKAGEKRPLDAGVEQGRPKRFRPAVSNSVSSNAPASSSSSFSDMPREPPSADAMYMDKRAGEIQAGIPDLSLDECLELARHEWLSLSAREREPMMDQWRQVENKYLADLKAWRAKNPHKSAELERQGIQKEEKEASREPAMKLHQLEEEVVQVLLTNNTKRCSHMDRPFTFCAAVLVSLGCACD